MVYDITLSKVPLLNKFELEEYTQICERVRRMPKSHNEVLKYEEERIPQPFIMNPSQSPWDFAVVIAKKKDVKPRVLVLN